MMSTSRSEKNIAFRDECSFSCSHCANIFIVKRASVSVIAQYRWRPRWLMPVARIIPGEVRIIGTRLTVYTFLFCGIEHADRHLNASAFTHSQLRAWCVGSVALFSPAPASSSECQLQQERTGRRKKSGVRRQMSKSVHGREELLFIHEPDAAPVNRPVRAVDGIEQIVAGVECALVLRLCRI